MKLFNASIAALQKCQWDAISFVFGCMSLISLPPGNRIIDRVTNTSRFHAINLRTSFPRRLINIGWPVSARSKAQHMYEEFRTPHLFVGRCIVIRVAAQVCAGHMRKGSQLVGCAGLQRQTSKMNVRRGNIGIVPARE